VRVEISLLKSATGWIKNVQLGNLGISEIFLHLLNLRNRKKRNLRAAQFASQAIQFSNMAY